MKAKLIVVGGDAKAAEVKLKLPTVIGRGREANLTLPHPLVSRKHCEIFEDRGRLCVRDLGSLNGTYVNNERISEATSLPSGDLLTVGAVTFRAVYAEPPPSSEPPGEDGTIRDVSNETSFDIVSSEGEATEREDLFDSVDERNETDSEADGLDDAGLDDDRLDGAGLNDVVEFSDFEAEPSAVVEEVEEMEEVEDALHAGPSEATLPPPTAAADVAPSLDSEAAPIEEQAPAEAGEKVAAAEVNGEVEVKGEGQEQPVAAAPQPPQSPQASHSPRPVVPSARPVQPPMARPAPTQAPAPANESPDKGDDDALDSFLKRLR